MIDVRETSVENVFLPALSNSMTRLVNGLCYIVEGHKGLNMLARDTPTTVRHQDEILTTTGKPYSGAVTPWVPYGTWQCMESFGCTVVLYALYAGTWRA